MSFPEESASLAIRKISTATAHGFRQHDKRRQIGSASLEITNDGSRMRRIHTTGKLSPGLHHLPAGIMNGRSGMMATTNQRNVFGYRGVLRQDFGELVIAAACGNRLERTSHFQRCVRLHVERVQLAGGTQIENHNAGAFIVTVSHLPLFFRFDVIGQRKSGNAQ